MYWNNLLLNVIYTTLINSHNTCTSSRHSRFCGEQNSTNTIKQTFTYYVIDKKKHQNEHKFFSNSSLIISNHISAGYEVGHTKHYSTW